MKNIVVILAVLIIAIALFGCITPTPPKTLTEAEARTLVSDDLHSKYPTADVREIIETTWDGQSWQINARVTFNYSSPCPVRMNVLYDYPRKGFVTAPPEYITKDCVVWKEAACVIGTPEEAIIASHTLEGTTKIQSYIDWHTDAAANATFYTEYFDTDTGTKDKNVWIVRWLSPTTNYGVFVMVANNGAITKVWEVAKSEIV